MNKEYKSIIFTNHSLDRLSDRSISQDMVWRAVSHPAKSFKEGDKTKFIATINGRRLHVVAQKLEKEKKWLIISTWVRGEDDPQPLVWRIITFPFWLLWKFVTYLLRR